MVHRPPVAVLLTTVLGFGCLYVPQPLLPVIAADFGVSAQSASLLITLALLPLAVAPLLYGYVLEGVAAATMMRSACAVLALATLGSALAQHWWQLLALRVLVGLALPALFTSLMTFVSQSARQGHVREAMAWYIAATILGGFLGRAVSGVLEDLAGWSVAFGFWALGLLLAQIPMARLPAQGESHFGRIRAAVLPQLLGDPRFAFAYLAILCVFFVFAGFLNVLPFRLTELSPGLGSTAVGLAYGGYLIGIVLALGGQRLAGWLGSEGRTLGAGLALYATGLACFALPAAAALYAGMFAFCAGMFLVHGRLSGHVNQMASRHRGMVNGFYIAAYYLGGSLGSWATPALQRNLGWGPLLGVLALVMAVAAGSLFRLMRAEESGLSPPG